MIIEEMRKLEIKELYTNLSNLYKELFTINFYKKVKAGEGLSKRNGIKKNIAMILTILNERKKEQS